MVEIAIFDLIGFDKNSNLNIDNSFLALEDYLLNLCTEMLGSHFKMQIPESTLTYIHKDFAKMAKDFNMGTEEFFRLICAMMVKGEVELEDIIPLVNSYRYTVEIYPDCESDIEYLEDVKKLILPYQPSDYEEILHLDKDETKKRLYFWVKQYLPNWKTDMKKGFREYDKGYYSFSEFNSLDRAEEKEVEKRYKKKEYKVESNYLKREYYKDDLDTHATFNVLPLITKETKIEGKTLEEIVLNIANAVRPDRYFVSEETGKLNVELAKELINRIQKGKLNVKDTGKYYKYFNVYNIYDVEKEKGLNAYSLLAQVDEEIYLERAIAKEYKKVTQKINVPKIPCYENYQRFCNATYASWVKNSTETENKEETKKAIKFAKEYPQGRRERKVNITGKVETVVVKDYDIYEDLENKIKENGGSIKVKGIHSKIEETDFTLKRLNRLRELNLIERFYTVETDGLYYKL